MLSSAELLEEVAGAEEADVQKQRNLKFGFVTGRYPDAIRLLPRIRSHHQRFPNLTTNLLACGTWTLRMERGVVVSQHKARPAVLKGG